ncbi:hypothetical protein [Streptomyces sp. NPDC048142]|uniref:hypothetical protein n=1 Tax=Streptomyces sp. NPDC048142 TaxID=3365501 RepID=UPI003712771D
MSTDAHLWHHDCAHRYLVDRDSSAVPPPPVPQDAAAWSQPLDAVDGDRTTVRATISAPDDGSVVVQRLAVRVVNRRPALDWPAYAMNPGCGGSLTPARYTVDLDVPRPLAQPESGGAVNHTGEARTLPAPRLPFQVTQGDPLVLRVEATAVHCDCDWYLEAEWTRGDQHGTLRIDDAGRPFRTSGKGAGKQYYYATEGSGWTAYSSPPRTSTL